MARIAQNITDYFVDGAFPTACIINKRITLIRLQFSHSPFHATFNQRASAESA
jgi:hypothetical protein